MNSGKALLAAIVTAVFLQFLLSFPAMLLWNLALAPAITGLVEVSWLQMWGIWILVSAMTKTSVEYKK
jgi:hypothetical protein